MLGQLEELPALAELRSKNAARLSEGLSRIRGIRPLPRQDALTSEAIYCYVFRYDESVTGVPRDMFVAALDAEGIPADGRFYEPVYRSDLFQPKVEEFPQLTVGRDEPVDYSEVVCPVSEKAAYHEAVWLPQFVLLGEEKDVDEIVRAVEKVVAGAQDLAKADPSIAGVKGMSRADRPKVEKKNY